MSRNVGSFDEVSSEWSRQKKRISWKHPCRSHHVNGKDSTFELVDVVQWVSLGMSYKVDHRIRYRPALATALKPT